MGTDSECKLTVLYSYNTLTVVQCSFWEIQYKVSFIDINNCVRGMSELISDWKNFMFALNGASNKRLAKMALLGAL
jgi:hypothetical protein